jgi:hypothetical protein
MQDEALGKRTSITCSIGGDFMTPLLTREGYEQTRAKLAGRESRLAEIGKRKDLNPQHHLEVRKSYLRMIGQYRREIKLYEATLAESSARSGK